LLPVDVASKLPTLLIENQQQTKAEHFRRIEFGWFIQVVFNRLASSSSTGQNGYVIKSEVVMRRDPNWSKELS